MRVAALAIYPVKGGGAVPLERMELDALGPLARLRLRDGEAVFGVRYSVERPGTIRVGDAAAAG